MPVKESSNMLDYVNKKNSSHAGTRQDYAPTAIRIYDDLKISTPKTTAAPNSGQARTNRHHSNRPTQAHAAQRDPTGQHTLYDTDVDSIGAPSTTGSAPKDHLDVAHRAHNGYGHGGDDVFEDSSNGHGSDEEVEEVEEAEEPQEQLPIGASKGLTLQQLQTMSSTDRSLDQKNLPNDGFPYWKGDSYPDTTSGRPSNADSSEMNAHPYTSQVPPHAKLPLQQTSSMRVPLGASSAPNQSRKDQVASRGYWEQSTVQDGYVARPDGGHTEELHQMHEGFSFGKPNESQIPAQQKSKPRRQAPVGSVDPEVSVSNNTANRATLASKSGESTRAHHRGGEKHQPMPQQKVESSHDHRRQSSKHRGRIESPAPVQPQVFGADTEHDNSQDSGADDEEPTFKGNVMKQQMAEPEENLLDYPRDELLSMDYQTLKASPFDTASEADAFEVPGAQTDADLNSMLENVAVLTPDHQARFFASLPIDEWEEAGDWFITQFGDALAKLKTNRQEKRKAAKAFEAEIERRHEAVSKKRKQTEEELAEMRESGVKVLQPTPKKTKTK